MSDLSLHTYVRQQGKGFDEDEDAKIIRLTQNLNFLQKILQLRLHTQTHTIIIKRVSTKKIESCAGGGQTQTKWRALQLRDFFRYDLNSHTQQQSEQQQQ